MLTESETARLREGRDQLDQVEARWKELTFDVQRAGYDLRRTLGGGGTAAGQGCAADPVRRRRAA